jgi:hypothetical protein
MQQLLSEQLPSATRIPRVATDLPGLAHGYG